MACAWLRPSAWTDRSEKPLTCAPRRPGTGLTEISAGAGGACCAKVCCGATAANRAATTQTTTHVSVRCMLPSPNGRAAAGDDIQHVSSSQAMLAKQRQQDTASH